MQGPESADGTTGSHRGLIPRSLCHLFYMVKLMAEDGWKSDVSIEIVEVYNETFRDLLCGPRPEADARIDIRQDKSGVRLTNVTTVKVVSTVQVCKLQSFRRYTACQLAVDSRYRFMMYIEKDQLWQPELTLGASTC